jgi:hypothetical protein
MLKFRMKLKLNDGVQAKCEKQPRHSKHSKWNTVQNGKSCPAPDQLAARSRRPKPQKQVCPTKLYRAVGHCFVGPSLAVSIVSGIVRGTKGWETPRRGTVTEILLTRRATLSAQDRAPVAASHSSFAEKRTSLTS